MISAKTRSALRQAFRVLKALFALTLAVMAAAGISYRIAKMHQQAVAPVFDVARDTCIFQTTDPTYGQYARLEPPISVPYLGFSIDWQVSRRCRCGASDRPADSIRPFSTFHW